MFQKLFENAKKLVKDKQFHIIATHDFDILKFI